MLVKMDTYFDGEYWCARGVNEDIFTQGETYDELLKNIKEAVTLHLEDELKKGKTAEILDYRA
ncbi:MAG: hypothetical protein A2073_01435 [Deltaproteobacteria bacterium GWC2_42_11]|nr:MAG: hypothetical protein A2073_01435 [Deltaproteobacteria bacterium GWC2_42_11]